MSNKKLIDILFLCANQEDYLPKSYRGTDEFAHECECECVCMYTGGWSHIRRNQILSHDLALL